MEVRRELDMGEGEMAGHADAIPNHLDRRLEQSLYIGVRCWDRQPGGILQRAGPELMVVPLFAEPKTRARAIN